MTTARTPSSTPSTHSSIVVGTDKTVPAEKSVPSHPKVDSIATKGGTFSITFSEGLRPGDLSWTIGGPTSGYDFTTRQRSERASHSRAPRSSDYSKAAKEELEKVKQDIASRRPLAQKLLPTKQSERLYKFSHIFSYDPRAMTFKGESLGYQTLMMDELMASKDFDALVAEELTVPRPSIKETMDRMCHPNPFPYSHNLEPVSLKSLMTHCLNTAASAEVYNSEVPNIVESARRTRAVPEEYEHSTTAVEDARNKEFVVGHTEVSRLMSYNCIPRDGALNATQAIAYGHALSKLEGLSHYTATDRRVELDRLKDEQGVYPTMKELTDRHAKTCVRFKSAWDAASRRFADSTATAS